MRAASDDLSGCHDRASTIAALEAMVAGGVDGFRPAVVLVDLDRGEERDDGHDSGAGDEFLGVVARRLHGAVREDDFVGRMDGDEFLVVCPRIATAAEAVRIAVRIADSLRHQIQIKNTRVGAQVSIGVAWSSGPGADAGTLVSQAGAAQGESKRRGDRRPVLFTPSLAPAPPPD